MAVKYLVSANGTDHLPVTGDDGKPDHRLMGAAWAALHGGYRGNKYDGPNKSEAISKLTAMYKSEGMDTPGSSSDHADLNGQWIEIFRAGDYGKNGNYSAADLDHVVSAYNPDFHEAPAVIGHPETNAPAYGWVAGVKRDGGTLLAQLRDVDPQFEEMVKTGAFKKRSASFYRKPDGIELRHIGFLGAQPPEVKGLAAIKFEEGFETAEVVFEEGSMAEQQKPIGEQIHDYFKNLFAPKNTATQFSEAELRPLIDAANAPLLAKVTDLEAKLAKQVTEFAERERKLVTGEHSGRVAEAVNKLRSAGKWVPAFEKMGLKVVFAELAKATETIEFGEPDKDGKKPKALPLDLLTNFLEKLPKIVPGGVRVTDDNLLQFSEAPRSGKRDATLPPMSMNSVRLHEMTVEFMEKNPALKLSYGEALSQVAAKNPELTMPGGQAAGAV
jgi:hypothetical protein